MSLHSFLLRKDGTTTSRVCGFEHPYSIAATIRYTLSHRLKIIGHNLIMFILAIMLWSVMCGISQAETFTSTFFQVDLGQNWKVSGEPHNMPHSVNVNFVNHNAHSSINVVVGSGQIRPYALLTSLQNTLRSQGAITSGVLNHGALLYFEYTLNGIKGFACSATNGTDVSSITVMGNPQVGLQFVRSFTKRNMELFPEF